MLSGFCFEWLNLPSFYCIFEHQTHFQILCFWFPVSRLHMKPIDLHPKSFKGIRIRTPFIINRTGLLIARASSDIDGTGGEPSSGSKEEAESKEGVVPVENLPLESKLQERAEQKLRMKLAKKIRLRRKRLLRKRKMRKKGRWPPSKMKKLKNVWTLPQHVLQVMCWPFCLFLSSQFVFLSSDNIFVHHEGLQWM